ncbi:MAG: GlsB/YeaQ/YmgE family stress response membrane protein [Chloroflexi bacterium]|nr:MAG: GlsB/YeaQ/YmgE family stress response membrane protein [Chloroflexota bacterium]
MVISVNGTPITLDLDSILVWMLVGLVAGFLASHLALGHGLGLFWDIIVGIVGGLFGGIVLAGILHFNIAVAGHPIISAMIMAFIGAAILLIIVRLFAGGRGYRRRAF